MYIKFAADSKMVVVAKEEEDLFNNSPESEEFCGYVDGILARYYNLIGCRQPMRGRFVQILMNDTNHLNLYEVEVHGI